MSSIVILNFTFLGSKAFIINLGSKFSHIPCGNVKPLVDLAKYI